MRVGWILFVALALGTPACAEGGVDATATETSALEQTLGPNAYHYVASMPGYGVQQRTYTEDFVTACASGYDPPVPFEVHVEAVTNVWHDNGKTMMNVSGFSIDRTDVPAPEAPTLYLGRPDITYYDADGRGLNERLAGDFPQVLGRHDVAVHIQNAHIGRNRTIDLRIPISSSAHPGPSDCIEPLHLMLLAPDQTFQQVVWVANRAYRHVIPATWRDPIWHDASPFYSANEQTQLNDRVNGASTFLWGGELVEYRWLHNGGNNALWRRVRPWSSSDLEGSWELDTTAATVRPNLPGLGYDFVITSMTMLRLGSVIGQGIWVQERAADGNALLNGRAAGYYREIPTRDFYARMPFNAIPADRWFGPIAPRTAMPGGIESPPVAHTLFRHGQNVIQGLWVDEYNGDRVVQRGWYRLVPLFSNGNADWNCTYWGNCRWVDVPRSSVALPDDGRISAQTLHSAFNYN